MGQSEIALKVRELGAVQPWSQSICLPHGIETAPRDQVSHGKNLVKWGRIRPLVEAVGVQGRVVLDVGCNEGYFSLALAQMGARVIGIDADPNRIEKARFVRQVLGAENLRFECMNIYSDEFLSEVPEVDFSLCLGFLHRVPDPISAVSRLALKAKVVLFEWKALKYGPHDEPFACYTGSLSDGGVFGTQHWLMSVACVEAMLRRAGFTRFHRVDDPSSRRAVLVAGRAPSPVFELPDRVLYRARWRTLLSHTKRYALTLRKIIDGRLNA